MNLKEIKKARVLKKLRLADVSSIQVTVNNKNGGCLDFTLSPSVDTEIMEDITGLFYEEATESITGRQMLIQNIVLSMPQFLIHSDDDSIPF